MGKQTTFHIELHADEFLNAGTDIIWEMTLKLQRAGLNPKIVKTIQGSTPTPKERSIDEHFLAWHKKYSFNPEDPKRQDELSRYMFTFSKSVFNAGWLSHEKENK